MFEVNVTIKCPDLLMAATVLSKVIRGNIADDVPAAPVPAGAVQPQMPAPAAMPQMPPVQPAPVNPFPAATRGAQMPMPGNGTPSVPTAPIAPGPVYTLDQLGRAGAELIATNPGKMTELTALLQQFGVPAITELKPEQLGSFATALRNLGARF